MPSETDLAVSRYLKGRPVKYSLIIPHFDDAERLDRLLSSVPVSREDVEVIVVDDCSPDQVTLDALRTSWSKVLWRSTPENAGAGVARNVGLDSAKGRWLVFADSDDEFLPEAFDTFDRVLRDDDDLVYFLSEAVQEVDGSPSVRSDPMNELVKGYLEKPEEDALLRLRLGHVNPIAKVYSRQFIESHGLRFDPVRRSNDVAFNLLAAVQARRVRAETYAVYRIYRRPGSLTANVSRSAFMERFLVSRSVAQRLETLGFPEAISATGQMLLSARYGPGVMLKVWWLSIRSPLYIEWFRVLDARRWWRFIVGFVSREKERVRSP